MPRTRGMLGPGSARMGGGGAKPGAPRTPMAGVAPRPPAGLPGGGVPPPRVRPPGAPVGLAGPAPGGAPPGAGGMGASGGFQKGGQVPPMPGRKPEERLAKGGGVKKFAKGGAVHGDSKPRHKPSGSFK